MSRVQYSMCMAMLAMTWLPAAHAEDTAFTYQGRIKINDIVPPNGSTYDMTFNLWGDPTSTEPADKYGGPVLIPAVPVNDGIFTVDIDFSLGVYDGLTTNPRWLEVIVQVGSDSVKLTRQPLSAVPFSTATRGITVDETGAVHVGGTDAEGRLVVQGQGSFGAPEDAMRVINAGDQIVLQAHNELHRSTLGSTNGAGQPYLLFHGEHSDTVLNGFKRDGTGFAPMGFMHESYGDRLNIIAAPSGTPDSEVSLPPIMSWLANGNIGINQYNPIYRLDVIGSARLFDGAFFLESSNALGDVQQKFERPDAAAMNLTYWGQEDRETLALTNDNGHGLHVTTGGNVVVANFSPATNFTGTGKLVVMDGSVGIGTTAPSSRLQVQQASDTNMSGAQITNSSINRSLHLWVDSSSQGRIDVGTTADSPILLNAGGLGNVGIGITNPGSRLQVNSGTGSFGSGGRIGFGGTDNDPFATMGGALNFNPGGEEQGDLVFHTRPTGPVGQVLTERMRILSGGNVGIGTTAPATKLHVAGQITADCGVLSCSDARFKTQISPLREALSILTKLVGVGFDWDLAAHPDRGFTDKHQIGFIAQQVREVLPEVVSEGSDGYLSVDYGKLTPVLVEGVKELHGLVQDQGRQIVEQNQRLTQQEQTIANLEARLAALERLTQK